MFNPGVPRDTHEVLKLYAAAAKIVSKHPDRFRRITKALHAATEPLVPPESTAAAEAQRLWEVFATVADKENLASRSARVLVQDLESLSQRIDMPPLPSWDALPEGIDDQGAVMVDDTAGVTGTSLKELRALAKRKLKKKKKGEAMTPAEAAELLGMMAPSERQEMFKQIVGRGVIDRGESSMVNRYLVKEARKLGKEDTALKDTLKRLGGYLTKDES